jgi:CheY-like chemotaxis protein
MDKRGRDRALIQEPVVINNIVKAYALDISEGGMYLHTQSEFIPGATLELSFKLKEKDIRVKAVVRHVQPGIGMGVSFINPSPETLSAIKDFLKGAPDMVKPKEKVILLVDDSEQSRSIYKNRLMSEGFTVFEASNGVEALKSIQENRPDLVILDLWMEGIDGFKFLQLIRLNPELKDIPVIVLSARVLPEDIKKSPFPWGLFLSTKDDDIACKIGRKGKGIF